MNKLKQVLKSKKGFTLMEVIIVVVILAVLAAALIPSFVGFVQRAGHSQAIAEARLGMTAAQAVVTEVVGRTGSAPALADINVANGTFRQIIIADGIPGLIHDPPTVTVDILNARIRDAFPSANIVIVGNRVVGLTYIQQGPTARFQVVISQADGAVVTPLP